MRRSDLLKLNKLLGEDHRKYCTNCEQDKSLNEFSSRSYVGKSGHTSMCKVCMKAYSARNYYMNTADYKDNADLLLKGRRKCNLCALVKDVKYFYALRGKPMSRCTECYNRDSRFKRFATEASLAKSLLRGAKKRAEARGLLFALKVEDINIPLKCPVLDITLETKSTGKKRGANDYSPSLDRIDNNKGYIPGNVLVVSWRANRIKSDATVEELRLIVNFYADLKYESSVNS